MPLGYRRGLQTNPVNFLCASAAARCADVKLFAAPELDRKGLSEPLSTLCTPAHVLSAQRAQEACYGMAPSLGECKKSALSVSRCFSTICASNGRDTDATSRFLLWYVKPKRLNR